MIKIMIMSFCSGRCFVSDDGVHSFSCVPFLSTTEVVNSIRRYLRARRNTYLSRNDYLSRSRRRPSRMVIGCGGQPGM